MCGEKGKGGVLTMAETGSPPHVRGKVEIPGIITSKSGITPACAGKSMYHTTRCGGSWDHPRMCGEKPRAYRPPVCDIGSPPHVRGKERGSTSRQRRKGITPACAGKSCGGGTYDTNFTDHPRMCGEKTTYLYCAFFISGSPPHVRGKGPAGQRPLLDTRITPACAGKSVIRRVRAGCVGDHPRMCGEKTKKIP